MKKENILVMVIALFFLGLSFTNFIIKTPDYSESERRVLAKFPEVNGEDILSGEFSKAFDEYATERFIARDFWRSVKAYAKTELFQQKDNHQIYTAGQHISKMDGPVNAEMIRYSAQLFRKIREKYLEENEIYLAVIPDKNWYLAKESGHLSLDYKQLSGDLAGQMDFAKYIELEDLLGAEDYYYTDTHWRQEQIVDVAERIGESMGIKLTQNYQKQKWKHPFYGVYVGQAALKCEPDTIVYLENELLKQVQIDGADAVYDMKKAEGRDPYEMFLSGNQAVITIKNPMSTSGKRLVIFRDSFGSSLAPLLTEGYSEIILVDLRYISSDMLAEYIDFKGADVLFLYSTLLLNNSRSMR